MTVMYIVKNMFGISWQSRVDLALQAGKHQQKLRRWKITSCVIEGKGGGSGELGKWLEWEQED